eukprot:4514525-Pleurochrysis_carterae.AAC.1
MRHLRAYPSVLFGCGCEGVRRCEAGCTRRETACAAAPCAFLSITALGVSSVRLLTLSLSSTGLSPPRLVSSFYLTPWCSPCRWLDAHFFKKRRKLQRRCWSWTSS